MRGSLAQLLLRVKIVGGAPGRHQLVAVASKASSGARPSLEAGLLSSDLVEHIWACLLERGVLFLVIEFAGYSSHEFRFGACYVFCVQRAVVVHAARVESTAWHDICHRALTILRTFRESCSHPAVGLDFMAVSRVSELYLRILKSFCSVY